MNINKPKAPNKTFSSHQIPKYLNLKNSKVANKSGKQIKGKGLIMLDNKLEKRNINADNGYSPISTNPNISGSFKAIAKGDKGIILTDSSKKK